MKVGKYTPGELVQQAPTINLAYCRYAVVEQAAVSLGFKVIRKEGAACDIVWCDTVAHIDCRRLAPSSLRA